MRLLREGWDWRHFDVVLAASGGPKWLVLSAIDRLLVEVLKQHPLAGPRHLLGSSSGAWRFAAYCMENPQEALRRLEHAYIDANWDHSQTMNERAASGRGILDAYVSEGALSQEPFRLHVVTAHCRHLLSKDHPMPQIAGLLIAAVLTAWKRSSMGLIVERALFSDPRTPLPSELSDVPGKRYPLREDNLRRVLMASGAIPLVLPAVRGVPGGPAGKGTLRDGGLVDYHFDHVLLQPRGLVLYFHFSPAMMPSWLERAHVNRRFNPEVTRRMVFIHPSPEWVATLPGGKLPNRTDAQRYSQRQRRWRWHEAAARSEELAECLERALEAQRPLELTSAG
jgi:hypothetical protein